MHEIGGIISIGLLPGPRYFSRVFLAKNSKLQIFNEKDFYWSVKIETNRVIFIQFVAFILTEF